MGVHEQGSEAGDRSQERSGESDGIDAQELGAQEASALPERQAMSVVTTNPNAALGMEMAEHVPAADQAPVGGKVTILPVEEEPL